MKALNRINNLLGNKKAMLVATVVDYALWFGMGFVAAKYFF
jgi:hypothetical protein